MKPFKTLVGIITFGNWAFTQLAIREILRTSNIERKYIFVVVGMPADNITALALEEWGIPFVHHEKNWGMPASLNDIYDHAFKGGNPNVHGDNFGGDYDAVIFVGNDVIVYPGAVDAMIAEAQRGEYDWICASEYSVKSLCNDYPEARAAFTEPNYQFADFTQRPWDRHADKVPGAAGGWRMEDGRLTDLNWVQANCRKDVRNLALFTRRSFEMLGYADVNFWPGGYFEDNDYGRRGDLGQVKACGLAHACYFHFWSRTIHQGKGTAGVQFQRNSDWYQTKWGGPVGGEKYELPFNGSGFPSGDKPAALKITSRDIEREQIAAWMAK